MGKGFLSAKVLLGLAVAALTSSSAGAQAIKAIGKGEGSVDIVAWPGYIERGETDKAYDWVTSFEKETGCKVNVKTAGTSDEMVALLFEGGFDLVTASGDASLRLISGKRVQPINTALIPRMIEAFIAKRLLVIGSSYSMERRPPIDGPAAIRSNYARTVSPGKRHPA